jgi:hypothetical protein
MKITMKNWKTTCSALIVVICGFVLFDPQYFPAIVVSISKYVALGGIASFGVSCKDFNVTGGTITQPTVPNPPTLEEKK